MLIPNVIIGCQKNSKCMTIFSNMPLIQKLMRDFHIAAEYIEAHFIVVIIIINLYC